MWFTPETNFVEQISVAPSEIKLKDRKGSHLHTAKHKTRLSRQRVRNYKLNQMFPCWPTKLCFEMKRKFQESCNSTNALVTKGLEIIRWTFVSGIQQETDHPSLCRSQLNQQISWTHPQPNDQSPQVCLSVVKTALLSCTNEPDSIPFAKWPHCT